MMGSPVLLTVPNENERRCCILDDTGNQCPQRSRFWVGSNDVDDYTHVCGDHVEEVRRDGDEVRSLEGDKRA